MTRIARLVIPELPHHVTQRGNRRLPTFLRDEDYRVYLDLLSEQAALARVAIWGYCLMPNHVHVIAVPTTADGLRRAFAETHRRHARHVNEREGWRGHLWQERFASFPMDDAHLLAAARYVELNPVRAGLVPAPEDWPWSSARAHLRGEDDGVVTVRPLLALRDDWREFLTEGLPEEDAAALRRHERTGRPLGEAAFVARLEQLTERRLGRQKPGPRSR